MKTIDLAREKSYIFGEVVERECDEDESTEKVFEITDFAFCSGWDKDTTLLTDALKEAGDVPAEVCTVDQNAAELFENVGFNFIPGAGAVGAMTRS